MKYKYYKLTEKKMIETVTTIPSDMWERKGLLPYEETILYIISEEKKPSHSSISILSDRVIGTVTKYRIVPTLEELKQTKKSEIKMIYNAKSYEGFACSNGITLDCRDLDKINWLSLKLSCQAYPELQKTIKDFDNNLHTDLENSEIVLMLSELEAYYNILMSTKWEKEQEIYASTKEDLNLVEWI